MGESGRHPAAQLGETREAGFLDFCKKNWVQMRAVSFGADRKRGRDPRMNRVSGANGRAYEVFSRVVRLCLRSYEAALFDWKMALVNFFDQ